MKRLTFKKGIHLNYHKEATADKKIELMLPNKELVFPMSQHIGAPCVPIVKKGDYVYVGQKIGQADGFMSVPIHSSVSGIVKTIETRMTFKGVRDNCVVIENDGLYEEEPQMKEHIKQVDENLTKEALIECIKEAGIVGMGGATFPMHVKLSTPPDKKVSYILVNGAECEPYLTSDHRVMLEYGEEVIKGLSILLHVFKEAQAIIGIEDNKMDAFEHMTQLAKGTPIKVQLLHTKYPQGSEKHLIYSLTQQEVPSGKLPIDVGCLVHNVDSVVAVYRAVTKGQPVTRRIVTVAGGAVKKPCNLEVKIGTSFREVLEYAEVDLEKVIKLIAGGPMMGVAISDIDIPIMKGTSAILCLTEEEVSKEKPSSCIRCGKCIDVCPMKLMPNALQKSAINGHYDAFLNKHGMECIECGCCAYTCPAKREIVQSIRTAKSVIRNKK
ncbi:MAG: electron transport complex subunit RsxC [Candidatus Cellulosilyticum pullistercoris]|uniref:Ion-translocating oxidoreductase complex subunit C n=1 Tax=Candidatus Cellulosilyticum pullistercoris TaxID=2838521 RepID=A0A9E2K857_9FIRM|nr:electron transport complex subunit RsxC [Candidatus Cellulosilyticum pullistercoris]